MSEATKPNFAYSLPRAMRQQLHEAGGDGHGAAHRSAHRASTTPSHKWVHHPLSDLWKLGINGKGALEWAEVHPTGATPFPRSRHTMEAVPSRGLALLFGGRSVHAATVLNDFYCLDVMEEHWAEIKLVRNSLQPHGPSAMPCHAHPPRTSTH